MNAEAAYAALLRWSREQALLGSCEELLGWDELTYMPRGGAAHRGNQTALLAGLAHERGTMPIVGAWLEAASDHAQAREVESPVAVNLREWRRAYVRSCRLPRALVEESARLITTSQQVWADARASNDFESFRPWLEKVIVLKQREAGAYGWTTEPYDALLEDYEPGVDSRILAGLFDELRRELTPLVGSYSCSPLPPSSDLLRRYYPLDRQQMFAETMAASLGFDFQRGRLDVSVHPFSCHVGPGDSRITTRYDDHDLGECVFTVLHEVGHAFYEQGFDLDNYGTPMAEAPSLGLHESQARLWENLVGRSHGFWRYLFPQAQQLFPDTLHGTSRLEFCRAIHRVAPSLIRANADEVSYNLHILIRFDLERALVNGELAVADMPEAWNDAYDAYLGIRPANDREGCLQDGHWASGLFGYFPTYALGNLFAAQLFAKADMEVGPLEETFSRGDFTVLLGWLCKNVFLHGSRYPASRLVEQVTGTSLSPRLLVKSFRDRYAE